MGRLGTISQKTPSLRFLSILLTMLIPMVLHANAYALEDSDFSKLDEKIQYLDNLIISSNQIPLSKINFELNSINNDFKELQNSIKTSNNYFEFSKYKTLSDKYLDVSHSLKEKLQQEQRSMAMDDILLSIEIRKSVAAFQNFDREITAAVNTRQTMEKERLMSDSREYVQNIINDVIVEKHFESYSPIINWLDVYKSAFNKIQKDEKFHAIPMTIDRLMLQYHDENLLRELLLLKLDLQLLIDTTTQDESYYYDDPPSPTQEEPEEEEPPGIVPRTSLGELNLTLNSEISETIHQITLIVDEHEQELKSKRLQSSSSSSKSSSFGSGSGGTGESGGLGDRPRDNNKADH